MVFSNAIQDGKSSSLLALITSSIHDTYCKLGYNQALIDYITPVPLPITTIDFSDFLNTSISTNPPTSDDLSGAYPRRGELLAALNKKRKPLPKGGGLLGRASDIGNNARSVMITANVNSSRSTYRSTVIHEIAHALGLWHTFSDGNYDYKVFEAPEEDKFAVFEQFETENIMDYSQSEDHFLNGNGKKCIIAPI